MPLYDEHFNSDRFKELVIHLLIKFVGKHTNIYKSPADLDNEDSDSKDEDLWNPMMTLEQVTMFLQVAECLIKQTVSPKKISVKLNFSTFKSLMMYEDSEVGRCALNVMFNRDYYIGDYNCVGKSQKHFFTRDICVLSLKIRRL